VETPAPRSQHTRQSHNGLNTFMMTKPDNRARITARIARARGVIVAVCLAILAGLVTPSPAAGATPAPQPQLGQHSYTLDAQAGWRNVHINYWLFLPRTYGQDPNKRWPLILFLHGSNEAGSNVNLVHNAILPQIVEQQPDFPFIVVSPQSPNYTMWDDSIPALIALLDDLGNRLAVDSDRVYLTGLSLGAFGAWALARREPERFAAIVPVVGGFYFNARLLCPLKDVPTWVFHGTRDGNVPIIRSQMVVNALRACGGNPRFTVYEGADHEQGWRRAYNEPALYEWLLRQNRQKQLQPTGAR
jgi:predicted peptidase